MKSKIKEMVVNMLESSTSVLVSSDVAKKILPQLTQEEIEDEMFSMLVGKVDSIFRATSSTKQGLICGGLQMDLPLSLNVDGGCILLQHATALHIIKSKDNSAKNRQAVIVADEKYQHNMDVVLEQMEQASAETAGEVLHHVPQKESA